MSSISRPSLPTDALTWNALGKLYRYKDSTYSYDVFGELVQTVTGPSGSQSTIVSVGDDFEYDIPNARANKFFSVGACGSRAWRRATPRPAESCDGKTARIARAPTSFTSQAYAQCAEQALCTQARTL